MTEAPATIHLLMVEDNDGDVYLARDTLEACQPNLELCVAIDGVEALACLRRQGLFSGQPIPDVVLLDLNLPRLNGREVLEAIKQDPALKRIPVIVLTSSGAEPDVRSCYELGASCYLIKPRDLPSFQRVIESLSNFWFQAVRLPQSSEPRDG